MNEIPRLQTPWTPKTTTSLRIGHKSSQSPPFKRRNWGGGSLLQWYAVILEEILAIQMHPCCHGIIWTNKATITRHPRVQWCTTHCTVQYHGSIGRIRWRLSSGWNLQSAPAPASPPTTRPLRVHKERGSEPPGQCNGGVCRRTAGCRTQAAGRSQSGPKLRCRGHVHHLPHRSDKCGQLQLPYQSCNLHGISGHLTTILVGRSRRSSSNSSGERKLTPNWQIIDTPAVPWRRA